MLSTGAMIKTGKVYKNLMVNVQATNQKLRDRSIRIIQEITGVDEQSAREVSQMAKGDTRSAILMLLYKLDYPTASQVIANNKGNFVKSMIQLEQQIEKE